MTSNHHEAPIWVGSILDPSDNASPRTTRALAEAFVSLILSPPVEVRPAMWADDVVYLASGRGQAAGPVRGPASVIRALAADLDPGAVLDGCAVTEMIVDGSRALIVVEMHGSHRNQPFRFETAFHLQCRDDQIIGITEYCGDQYTADQLTHGSRPSPSIETAPCDPESHSAPTQPV